ncbi:MAG: 3',5'-cyclic-AMP phosphodiesterase [Cyanobacteria bacterium P01_E01_bin.34]
MTDSLYAIQITDTHLFARRETQLLGVPTERTFRTVLAAIADLTHQPEILLATGDLSQDGSFASYQRFRCALTKFPADTYWLAGNHDQLSEMEMALGSVSTAASGPHAADTIQSSGRDRVHEDKVFVRQGWRFVLLNSAVPQQVGGRLAPSELQWLRHQLKLASDRLEHVAVCLHHPPYLMGSQWLDSSTLENSDDFLAVLAEFHCVRCVLFGHVHQAWEYQHGAVHFLGCPSTCVQFKPRSQQFAIDENAPGVRQLWFYPDGRLVTDVLRIPDAATVADSMAAGY